MTIEGNCGREGSKSGIKNDSEGSGEGGGGKMRGALMNASSPGGIGPSSLLISSPS